MQPEKNTKMRLLIVEDNADIAAGIRLVALAELRDEITNIRIASTVGEAMNALEAFRPRRYSF